MIKLPYDYIRGLVEGEGSFTFSTTIRKLKNGTIVKSKIPAFAIGMHERDEELLKAVRDTLGLTNKIYNYHNSNKDGHERGRKVFLIVREFPQIKNIIIPFFYKKLHGNKSKQFIEWLERMSDVETNEKTKFIYRLYKVGYFDKN